MENAPTVSQRRGVRACVCACVHAWVYACIKVRARDRLYCQSSDPAIWWQGNRRAVRICSKRESVLAFASTYHYLALSPDCLVVVSYHTLVSTSSHQVSGTAHRFHLSLFSFPVSQPRLNLPCLPASSTCLTYLLASSPEPEVSKYLPISTRYLQSLDGGKTACMWLSAGGMLPWMLPFLDPACSWQGRRIRMD